MKLKVVAKDCEIIKVGSEPINDKNGNYTGYDWHRVMLAQGFDSNTLTVDKTCINMIKPSTKMDLVIQITDDPKNPNNSKFKVVGVSGVKAPEKDLAK